MLSSSKSLTVGLRYNIVGKREEVLIEFRLINMPGKDKVPFKPSLCKNWILSWNFCEQANDIK
jgi:hypothetical protein